MAKDFQGGSYIVKRSDMGLYIYTDTSVFNVAAGAQYDYSLYAPAGSYCRLQLQNLYAPNIGAATTGTHYINVTQQGSLILSGTSPYNASVMFGAGYWRFASTAQIPADVNVQCNISKGLLFTDTVPIVITYKNNTDALQSGAKTYIVISEKQVIS